MSNPDVESPRLNAAIKALEHYADQYCEGWCERSNDCAKFDDECGGCRARSTLRNIALTTP